MKIQYSVVIPVYNSQRSIESLLIRLTRVMKQMKGSYEIICVDDGSSDGSWGILEKQMAVLGHLRIIRLIRNFGQHRAILCGLRHVRGSYVFTLDDDLQNPPEEIPKLLRKMESGHADVVIGTPMRRKQSFVRNMGSTVFNRLFTVILKKPPDTQMGSMFCIKRSVVDAIGLEKTPNPLLGALVFSHTHNVANVTVIYEKRKYGSSTYSYLTLMAVFYDLVINYSTIPLRAMSIVGFLSFLIGCIGSMVVAVRTLVFQKGLQGWSSIITVLFLFFGLTLMSFSIVGEYLTRILQEVSETKQYVIRQKKF
jgi:glycosyltransferase involved in cell wall biosynthesis